MAACPPANAAAAADFYAEALPARDRAVLARAGVGSLDEEVRLARFKLFCLIREEAEQAWRGEPAQGELELEPPKKSAAVAKTNFGELMARQLDLIRKLELAALHLRLRTAAPDEDADVDDAPLDDPDESAPPCPVR